MTTNTDTTTDRPQNRVEVHETTNGERELAPFMTGVIAVELKRGVREHAENIRKYRTGRWSDRDDDGDAEELQRELAMAKALTYLELRGAELPD